MQTINKILIISLLTIISFCSFAQEKKYDAVFNNIKKEYVINKDGSIDFTYRKELKLISNRSFFRDYGETFIIYNPEFQSLKINESYTIRENGSILQTPENAFNEVLPAGCADCARYNNMKEMVVTHTGLEYDATIVLDYTIHTKPEFITEFMETIYFAEFSPVMNYDVYVKVPSDIHLNERMLNIRLGANIKETGMYKTYHWNVKNQQQTISESYMPNYEELYPVLILSTFKDNQRAYFNLVNQEAVRTTYIPEAENAIKELIYKEKSDLENILAIRNYVIDYIKYNNFNLKYNNYKIATSATVWQTRCGNEAEKAMLLTSMLNTAGFEATPVTFTKAKMHSNNIGCLDIISHWGVRVISDNAQIIISPIRKSNVSMEIEYPEYAMHFLNSTVETIRPVFTERINTEIDCNGKISIDVDGNAKGVLNIDINSSKLPVFTILNDGKKAADVAKNISGESTGINLREQKLHIGLNTKSIIVADMQGGYYSFELPETKYGIAINPSYLNTKRETTVVCGKTKEKYCYEITVPNAYKFIGDKIEKIVEKPFGKLLIRIVYNKNIVEVERVLEIYQDYIDLEDYNDFREMMILWNNEAYKKMIFKL